jgi:tetratricopeptide (TPR) repeat protein
MRRNLSTRFSIVLVTGLLALLLNPLASPAATPCASPIATMTSVQGDVQVRRSGQTQWQPARLNDAYCAGDRIQVGDRSRADLALANEPVLRLDQNTTITLGGIKDQHTSLIDMARGALHFFSRLPRNLEVNTAFVNAGVEGTEGLIEVEANRTLITIFNGKVLAANPSGSVHVTGGQTAVAEKGKSPVLSTVVKPRDAVQWALYYPPVTYLRPADFQGAEPWQGMVRKSLEAYKRGDYQAAFDALKGVPPDIREPRFFAYRAQLLLGVGRADEASKDIERALQLSPNYSDALALQAVIAVVQNDKEKAFAVAQKAVAADPKSATALTALSYADQANFNLEGARDSLEKAVQVDPNNALAWARLSEIHLSFARLDEALEAAQKAVALDPNLSRTQMVLGFAYLTEVNTSEAKKAFEKAIELDQANFLARLGLGLAKIREGDLHQGGREIEIAASLNPNNSIVRSYLGKTYYEEKRGPLDEREYAIAKKLDPKDPTPWFYDAIAKQTTNRPVEALHDMQQAIELNDNRAVYRSKLELDSDLAARSASQARIYSDLGFQQLALVEGWKSVNTDPTNYSAHRFLADSYSILPRHEIARVSELLQSQLLQPLNMTPIQPQLAEANLGLISAGGPGTLSFNEFNPLFNRNGFSFQTTGVAGNNSTYAGEGVLAGIYNKFSFSAGGSHFQTNGFHRPGFTLSTSNTYQKDNIGDTFLQFELTPKTSIQAEYRYRLTNYGDLQQRFFRDDFYTGANNHEERSILRLGGRHAFSPNSILLASYVYQHANTGLEDDQFPLGPLVGIPLESILKNPIAEEAFTVEFQHLFRSRYVNLTSGVGYAKINGDINVNLSLGPPFGPLTLLKQKLNADHRMVNVYTYAHINLLKNLTLTWGASGVFLHGSPDVIANDGDVQQFNPKVGIMWEPIAGTTVRAAAFRNLKRTLVTNQTLEPTQVAGFNQFYDEFNATDSWRYGAAIDQKFTKNIFAGVEGSHRDREVPIIDVPPTGSPNTRWKSGKEDLARTYLFWTPHKWFGLRAEYQFERFKNEEVSIPTFEPLAVYTHRVPLGVSFFHPSGFSTSLTTTYWNQSGKFQRTSTGETQSGSDHFWTVDAAINYRLPQRYGFITLGARNLFNQKFDYYDVEFHNPRLQPDRMVFFKVTLSLP